MAYNFSQDYTIEQRKALLNLRTTLRNKIDGNAFTQAELDAMKNLTLDMIHQLIDEPQINADDREYSLSVDPNDRSKQINISNSTVTETIPAYFSDGKRIAYDRTEGTLPSEIWSMNTDGTNKTQLIATPEHNRHPHVQDNFLVFVRTISATNSFNNIFVLDLDTMVVTQVTNTTNIAYSFPKLSPDTTKIAFQSDEFGAYQIFTINRDGTGKFRVVTRTSDDEAPHWSPDGASLTFFGTGGGSYTQIWTVVAADGTLLTNISNTTSHESQPTYSPNGKRIAFATTRFGTATEIMTMDINGSNVIRLTDNPSEDNFAQYSPDGVYLACARSGQIYIMPADGVPVHPEYRHEYLMRTHIDYHNAWAYQHAESFRLQADASSILNESVLRGRRDWTYREDDPAIVDRSLLRHGYREARVDEPPPPEVVGKRAPPPGT